MQKIYFASDFHLGLDAKTSSKNREKLIVKWLDEVSKDASHIYLVGDLFDFWFEYKFTAPKGYTRFLGKLGELTDKGIIIEVFTGNHDMWMFSYLQEELGIPIHRAPIIREFFGKRILIGHGDGLGPGDHGYKFLKNVFANPV
ncbi:MAG TPA: UDP-2,3-diacylglucosamine diphosphatase, partial [Saprospiraceae bacterium]|nr:UDP-2,3-diacylglucosamine diphosphatase [Saprospiraceae bacterium]